jgi:hypothetical protein
MLGMKRRSIVICEPDLQGALAHLRALPYPVGRPASWDRQRLLSLVREAVGRDPNVNAVVDVAPGVVARVKPFGVDLAGWSEDEHRLQVWLFVRGWGTDPGQVVAL